MSNRVLGNARRKLRPELAAPREEEPKPPVEVIRRPSRNNAGLLRKVPRRTQLRSGVEPPLTPPAKPEQRSSLPRSGDPAVNQVADKVVVGDGEPMLDALITHISIKIGRSNDASERYINLIYIVAGGKHSLPYSCQEVDGYKWRFDNLNDNLRMRLASNLLQKMSDKLNESLKGFDWRGAQEARQLGLPRIRSWCEQQLGIQPVRPGNPAPLCPPIRSQSAFGRGIARRRQQTGDGDAAAPARGSNPAPKPAATRSQSDFIRKRRKETVSTHQIGNRKISNRRNSLTAGAESSDQQLAFDELDSIINELTGVRPMPKGPQPGGGPIQMPDGAETVFAQSIVDELDSIIHDLDGRMGLAASRSQVPGERLRKEN